MHAGREGGAAWADHSVAKTVLAVGTMETVLLLLRLEAGALGPTLGLHVVFFLICPNRGCTVVA